MGVGRQEEVLKGYSGVPSCFNDSTSFTVCSCNRGYFVEFADRFERRFSPFLEELFGRKKVAGKPAKTQLMKEILVHFEHILWHGLATDSYPRLLQLEPNITSIRVIDCLGDTLIIESVAKYKQPDTCDAH
ncbi:hypothetical protein AAVH_14156 [Aphelenchoides avenae]|nr:hypothetical protein AAVH_14156 [Aphelenchus avenae]